MRNREILENHLDKNLSNIKHDRRSVEKIKMELMKNKVKPGESQQIISGMTKLSDLDPRVLCLLTIHVHNITRDESIHPEIYFTPTEVKSSETFQEWEPDDTLTLPYTFQNVEQFNYDDFECPIMASELKRFFDSKLINYNFNTQREARTRTDRKNPNNIIQIPKVNNESVAAIANLMSKGQLIRSTLTLNVRVNPLATEPSLIYNEKERTLAITPEATIDILDGFHRLQGIVRCLNGHSDVDMKFGLKIVHYDVEKAQNWFSQINTVNPVSKSRLEQTNPNKFSSIILGKLQENKNSLIKDKISGSDFIKYNTNILVAANTLSLAINEMFKIEDQLEAYEVADYLIEFFNQMVKNNPDAFMRKIGEIRKTSVINTSSMFYGYIVLAKRFKDNNIPLSKLGDFMESIDFSRTNPLWNEMKITDEEGRLSGRSRDKIKHYFSNIELLEVANNG